VDSIIHKGWRLQAPELKLESEFFLKKVGWLTSLMLETFLFLSCSSWRTHLKSLQKVTEGKFESLMKLFIFFFLLCRPFDTQWYWWIESVSHKCISHPCGGERFNFSEAYRRQCGTLHRRLHPHYGSMLISIFFFLIITIYFKTKIGKRLSGCQHASLSAPSLERAPAATTGFGRRGSPRDIHLHRLPLREPGTCFMRSF